MSTLLTLLTLPLRVAGAVLDAVLDATAPDDPWMTVGGPA